MVGESLFKTLLLWLPRKFLPARLRHRLGIYTYSEWFAKTSGEGFRDGLRASGLFESVERPVQKDAMHDSL